MSRIIDISLGISPAMILWPGDPPVAVEPRSRLASGDHANVSELRLGSHTGTHVDPPFHFIDGAPTVDALALDALVGPCVVADLRGVERDVGPTELDEARIPDAAERVLLRTRNSELWARGEVSFPDDYVAVTPEGARWLASHDLLLVGTDFLSIERRGAPGHPTHVVLLQSGVVIVEGLDLSAVEPGSYTLACLPLKVVGGDGAPARAVLIVD
jgi:arylformamidase